MAVDGSRPGLGCDVAEENPEDGMGMQLGTPRKDDSLVASMHALRRFEADREERVLEAAREEAQRVALAEAEMNEAERRRFEAEVFAAVVASAAKPRVWLRASLLSLVLVLSAVTAGAYWLDEREGQERAQELQQALLAARQAGVQEARWRARAAQLEGQMGGLREENAELAARLPWAAEPPPPAPGPAAVEAPAPAAVVVKPLAPAVEEAKVEATPAAAEPPAEPERASRRRSRHADDAPAPKKSAKASKLDFVPCPPNQPICR
jgi:hypothetical protein